MTLKNLKRIAADSNVLLSAVIGKSALKVFTHTELEIFTTANNVEEVEEYLPQLTIKYHLNSRQVLLQWRMLSIHVVPISFYKDKLEMAKNYLKQRDPDDIHLAALALKNKIPVWSNDKDYEGIPGLIVYPTAKLLNLFHL